MFDAGGVRRWGYVVCPWDRHPFPGTPSAGSLPQPRERRRIEKRGGIGNKGERVRRETEEGGGGGRMGKDEQREVDFDC